MTQPKIIPTLAPRESYVDQIIIVDGIMRTGKFLHDAVVSSLERCEMWQQYPMLDAIPYLWRLGIMSTDTARTLIQREVDMHFYYTLLGRRVNFRYDDRSSIWHHHDPREYFQRIFMKEEAEILENIEDKNRIFTLSGHDMLCNVEIMFQAYPNLRMVAARRHPLDIIYSWHMKDWGNRIGTERRSLWLAFEGPTGPIPWHACEWAEKYESLSAMDRVIYSVGWLLEEAAKSYAALSAERQSRIFQAPFEWVVTDPQAYVAKLCEHIGTEPSAATPRILTEERIPRVLQKSDLEDRITEIKAHASAEAFDYALQLGEKYEEECGQTFDFDVRAARH